jgi:hypothetical protein
VNPIPAIIAAALLGYYFGVKVGQQMYEDPDIPTWEDVQAALAREGLQ